MSMINYRIVKSQTINKLIENEFELNKILLLKKQKVNTKKFKKFFFNNFSQNSQDLFVLSTLKFKKNGFFCEIGANDGITFSNTYLLEKFFKWKGILIEPSKTAFKKLKKNRKSFLSNSCIHNNPDHIKTKGILNETKDTMYSFLENNINFKASKKYIVEVCNINFILKKYKCKKNFDYLSIDTEGNEYEIISKLDFQKYKPKIITIEHNYNKIKRKKIKNFLEKNNYNRIYEDISLFDDWYVYNKD